MNTTSPPFDPDLLEALLDVAPHCRSLEHDPGKGRITLKIKLSGLGAAKRLAAMNPNGGLPGVLDAEFKTLARKAHILYDPAVLSPGLWEALLGLAQEPETRDAVRQRLLAAASGESG